MKKLFDAISNIFSKTIFRKQFAIAKANEQALQASNLLLGRILSNQIEVKGILRNIQDAEFKVFSQWGDDGIIQYLIQNVEIDYPFFVEFGVENYTESNTRFLLMNNNWSGLVMDGTKDNIDFIKQDEINWKYQLEAKHAFITLENVNELIKTEIPNKKIGLLHIDIDGNDYWVWEAIDCIDPTIVIMEYNSLLGQHRPLSIPYDASFFRGNAHYSYLYSGCSLKALCHLANEKGYVFVGSNSAGNNAYFVKKEKQGSLIEVSCEEGYVASKFRESRNKNGALTFLPHEKAVKLIKGLIFKNTQTLEEEIF